jgi:GT2 family glycosyltransferase
MRRILKFMAQLFDSQLSARVSVIIASLGRPDALGQLLDALAQQSKPADEIILSVTDPRDVPEGLTDRPGLKICFGPKGLCAQRNTGLANRDPRSDLVIFCDDDFVPSRFYVGRVRAFFAANADVAGVTGRLLADGINGPGISFEEARAMLAGHEALAQPPLMPKRDFFGLYGCNMAFRCAAIGEIRFDERLPLYGWQEDIDFSAQVGRNGRLVSCHGFAGVHCGIKKGRAPGVRLGYSQIINPAYLAHKGTMPAPYAARIALRNFLSNHWRALWPEPWADRAGRAYGNWLGLFDLLRGRLTPERMQYL